MIIRRLFATRKAPLDLVKKIRALTLSSYHEIGKALQASNGDQQGAIDWLRKKGIADASSKAGLQTKHGVISARLSDDRTRFALLEVNCETDFVAKSDVFLNFVEALSVTVLSAPPEILGDKQNLLRNLQDSKTDSHFEETRSLAISKLKENVTVGRVECGSGKFFGSYVHSCYRSGIGLKGSVVELVPQSKTETQAMMNVADTLALQVMGSEPEYHHVDQVPAEVLAEWTEKVSEEIKDKLAKVKPQIAKKMLEGKLRKAYYEEKVLESMPLLADPEGKLDVQTYLRINDVDCRIARRWVWHI